MPGSNVASTGFGRERTPAGSKARPPPGGRAGVAGVQLRGVELNRVVGSGGVEADSTTVTPFRRRRHPAAQPKRTGLGTIMSRTDIRSLIRVHLNRSGWTLGPSSLAGQRVAEYH
ncbi:hypothetical protein GCM10009818_02200 [Nakamurella flavida]